MNDLERALAVKETIRGDLRDIMVGALASMTKLWRDMPETEQIAVAQIMNAHAEAIVTRMAILTATSARPAVLVTLDKLVIGEQVRGTFTVSKELAANLTPATKQIVAIQTVGANLFMGERGPAQTMPDQRQLPGTNGAAPEIKTIELVAQPGAGGAAQVSAPAAPAAKPAKGAKPGKKPARTKSNGSGTYGSPFGEQ